jgi:MFS family permease
MVRSRDLVVVSAGTVISMFGTALSMIALLLAVRTSGAFAVAGVTLAEALAIALCAPLAGVLIDRFANRRLMMLAQVVQGGAAIGMALSLPRLGPVLGLLFLLGCGSAVAQPAGAALLPVITGESAATRGYAWLSTATGIGQLLGSTAGAVLVATVGARDALLVDGLTYLAQAALLSVVRAERRPEHPAGARTHAPGQFDGMSAGLRFLRADRTLTIALLGFAVAVTALVMVNVAEVFLVTGLLHGGAITLGVLSACWLLGMIAGGRLSARLAGQRVLAVALSVSCVASGLLALVPAVWPVLVGTALAWLFGGLCNEVQNVANQSLTRERTPDAVRGRVFAARGAVVQSAFVLGIALGGVVLQFAGVRWSLTIAGLGALLAGLLSLPHALRVRPNQPATEAAATRHP